MVPFGIHRLGVLQKNHVLPLISQFLFMASASLSENGNHSVFCPLY